VAPAILDPVRDVPRRRAPRAGPRVPLLWAVLVPFVAIAVVRALQQPMPGYFPDETLYQHLAQSVANGHGFTWRGDPEPLRAALYVYLVAPAWMISSGAQAYDIAKVETALLWCLVAVPVWRVARAVLPDGPAALAVALSLAGTWSANPGGLMTESLALPLATATLAVTVEALRRSSSRLVWLALLLSLLACWARLQLAVLLPIVFAALLIDVARAGRAWQARLRLFRLPLALLGTGLAAGLVVAKALPAGLLGGYSGVVEFDTTPVRVAQKTGWEVLQLATVCGFLPVLLLAVLAVRRAAWRDAIVGPFLAVLLPAVVLVCLESGYFLEGYDNVWPIQRYVIYVAPMLLLLCVVAVARPGLVGWRTWAVAGAIGLLLLLTPEVLERAEERAAFATTERVQDVLPGASTATAVTLVAVVLCVLAGGLAATAAPARRGRRSAAAGVGGLLLVVLVVQSATAWSWEHATGRTIRHLLPADAAWIDHHSHGPVAVLIASGNTPKLAAADFFNQHIARVYVPAQPRGQKVQGAVCRWGIAAGGALQFPASCPPRTQELWIDDPVAHLRFYDEVSTARDPRLGRIVRVRGAPRAKSLVILPCADLGVRQEPLTARPVPAGTPQACSAALTASLWLDAPGTLIVTVRGAPLADHVVTVGGRAHLIRSGTTTAVGVRVGAGGGAQRRTFRLDWDHRSPADPEIVGVDLVQGGRRQSLL
jgi:hypothetical protein